MAVAGGLFALLIALGVISRFAGKTHTAKYIFYYEDAAALGGILGNAFSVYHFRIPVGMVGVVSFGLFSGIYTGAWSMALTEIVDIVPIFSRRVRLKRGMPALILSMALGRTFGALFYYYLRL
jgi:stage V sporulation protein AB